MREKKNNEELRKRIRTKKQPGKQGFILRTSLYIQCLIYYRLFDVN